MNRFLFLLLLLSGSLSAQELSYGFEVGLNFSSFNGPSETDANGANLESFRSTNGFHVGGNLRLKIVDRFGVKAEALFSQKGGKNIYEGEGVQIFNTVDDTKVLSAGMRKTIISVTNSYIDIPIMGYFRPVSRIELFAGASVSFLVGSTGIGEFTYSGQTSLGGDNIEFLAELDHNYSKDLARDERVIGEFEEVISFEVNGNEVRFPESLGAYYLDYETKSGKLYNTFDLGLVGGAHFYFNGSLYLGVRLNYGLLDVTNNTYDISYATSNGTEYIPRSDIDRNFSLQASLGFSF